MKEYKSPEMELVALGSEDVIRTSGVGTETTPYGETGGVWSFR